MLVTGTDHPARGKTGEVVRVEKFQGVGMGAVVRFDDGLESAVFPGQGRLVGTGKEKA